MKKKGCSAEEVLSSYTKLHKPDNLYGMVLAWKESVKEFGWFDYGAELTTKQRMMLKHFRKVCPPGKDQEVLRYVVENWIEFAKRAEAEAGAFNVPTKPRVDFLQKYVEVAVNMWHKQTSKPAPEPEKMAKGFSKEGVQSIAKPEKDVASLEEVMAILDGDDKAKN